MDTANQMQVFNNATFGNIRVVQQDGEPWFVVSDVCEYFGITNRNRVMQQIDAEDKGGTQINTPGGKQTVTIINESGLYALLFALQPTKARGIDEDVVQKRVEQIKLFKRWITHEVIPTIRKHGAYMTPETIEKTLTDPDFIIQLATQLKDEQAKRAALEAKIEADAPKVLFSDSVEASDCSILVGQLAKQLRQNGVDIGQQRLFKRLREEGYLCSSRGDRYNMPTQRAMDMGLFEIKERTVNNPDGSIRVTFTPMVSGKGQIYFTNRYMKSLPPKKSVLQRLIGG